MNEELEVPYSNHGARRLASKMAAILLDFRPVIQYFNFLFSLSLHRHLSLTNKFILTSRSVMERVIYHFEILSGQPVAASR